MVQCNERNFVDWKKVQDKGQGAPCCEKPLEKSGLEPAAPNCRWCRRCVAAGSSPGFSRGFSRHGAPRPLSWTFFQCTLLSYPGQPSYSQMSSSSMLWKKNRCKKGLSMDFWWQWAPSHLARKPSFILLEFESASDEDFVTLNQMIGHDRCVFQPEWKEINKTSEKDPHHYCHATRRRLAFRWPDQGEESVQRTKFKPSVSN